MKILFVINSLGNSAGMERVLCSKTNFLAKTKHYQVYVLTLRSLPEDLFFSYSPKIKLVSIDCQPNYGNILYRIIRYPFYRNKIRKKLTEKICSIRPDIVVSMFGDELPILPQLKDGSIKLAEFHYSRNYLVHLVKSLPKLKLRWLHYLYAICFQAYQRKQATKYDTIVLLTEKDRNLWGDRPNLRVIPNPLSFRLEETANLDSERIISVGRLIAQKGFDLLIESFSLIASMHKDWELIIVGEGQDKGFLEQLIKKNDLQKSIKIIPPKKEVEELFLTSSIYCLTSRYEGFGLVLLEAMECGLPCIAFDCECGPSEIIQNEVDGFLIDNGNLIQFAEKLDQLMTNNELRKRMGAQAKLNVRRFDVELVMRKWQTLFEELTA